MLFWPRRHGSGGLGTWSCRRGSSEKLSLRDKGKGGRQGWRAQQEILRKGKLFKPICHSAEGARTWGAETMLPHVMASAIQKPCHHELTRFHAAGRRLVYALSKKLPTRLDYIKLSMD